MNNRIVVIGFGIAGLSAARSIREHDSATEIVILTDEGFSFYSRPGLAYNLTGVIPESQLFPLKQPDFNQLSLKVLPSRVQQIEPERHFLLLTNGKRLAYDRLLIATGSSAVKPSIPGMELEGVVTFDTLADTRHILRLSRRARRAVVVGGGITAVELAEGFAAQGLETHYLLRGDRYWKNIFDPVESKLVLQGMQHEGIQIHTNRSVERVLGKRGRVKAILTNHGEKITCQMVGVAIGIRPNIELALGAGLETDRGILVDEHLRTSHADIYAAGDVAQVYDPQSGTYKCDSLWTQAQEQGWAAGLNMIGGTQAYLRSTPFNVTRVGGVITTIIGSVGMGEEDPDLVSIVHGDSENWKDRPDSFIVESNNAKNRIRLVIGRSTLVGAIIMGDQSMSGPILEMIRGKLELGRFRQILIEQPERSLEILHEFAMNAQQDKLVLAS